MVDTSLTRTHVCPVHFSHENFIRLTKTRMEQLSNDGEHLLVLPMFPIVVQYFHVSTFLSFIGLCSLPFRYS